MKAKPLTPSTQPGRDHATQRTDAGVPSAVRPVQTNGKLNGAQPLYLTPRQREVLALLCQGMPNKLISRRLNIAAATVKVHIGCILRELGVSSRLHAVVVASRFGLDEATSDTETTSDR